MRFDVPELAAELNTSICVATVDDVPGLHDLIARYETAVTGTTAVSKAEISEAFDTETGRNQIRSLTLRSGGQIVGRYLIQDDKTDRYWADVTVDQTLGERYPALAAAGVRWIEQTALRHLSELGKSAARIKHWAWDGDAKFRALLDEAGYRNDRAFIEMHIDLADRAPFESAPDVQIRQLDLSDKSSADARLGYDLVTETFRDHYDFVERPFEDWMQRRIDMPHMDWQGWFVAYVDGKPAGISIHDDGYIASDNAGYIANLGTERWARGRGVAKALLRHSFDRAAEQGRVALKLHVDAESPTGATHLYEAVGMRRNQIGYEYEKQLEL